MGIKGVDGWYLGPSMNHYWYNKYYIPKTRAHRVSGSTEFFPQDCQLPDLTPHQHFGALTKELTKCISAPTNKKRETLIVRAADKDRLFPQPHNCSQ